MNDPESKLTIHIESDNFADGGLYSVACDAKVNAGVESADMWQLQLSSVMDWNWKGQIWFQCCFFYQERCSNPRPSGCVVTKYFYLSYEGYRKKITWLRTSPSLQSLSLLSWPPFLASLWQSRMFLPSSRLHAMAGVGFPVALQVRATRMPSVANVSELLSSSIMSGGTEWRNNNMI